MVSGTITQDELNVRENAPGRSSSVVGRLRKGDTVNIAGAVYGEEIDGVNIWYKLDSGHYIWSGYVFTDPMPKPQRKKVLFTADDYGVVDSVNRGVIRAIQEGQLNSVTCLTNYGKDGIDSIKNIRLLQGETGSRKVELGVHLTITSGSPLIGRSNAELLCRAVKDKQPGYAQSDFFVYTEVLDHYENLSINDQEEFRAQLEAELDKQIQVFINPPDGGEPVSVDHLTSHHNSLLYHPHFFGIMQKMATRYRIVLGDKYVPVPLRSLNNIPVLKDNLFMNFKGKVNGHQRQLDIYRSLLETMAKPGIQTPDLLNSNHYGPIPVMNKSGTAFPRLVNKKTRKGRDMIDDLLKSEARHMEFLLHLRDGEVYRDQLDFSKKETDPTGYAGIDPMAFDTRTAELEAFIKTFPANKKIHNNTVELISWREIRMG